MEAEQSLQEKYAPKNMCFGCGVANPDGLHIRSFLKDSDESRAGDEVVAEWKPEKKYEAFEGVLNVTRLPLQLDGGVPSDETRRRKSSAVHSYRGIRHQTAATDTDERLSLSLCQGR